MMGPLERLAAPGFTPKDWQTKVRWTSGDATLKRIAFIDWKGRRYFSFEVDKFFSALVGIVGSEDRKLIIAIAEFLVVIVGAILAGKDWEDCVILYVGDNENVQHWLEVRKAGTLFARFLLRLLRHLEIT